MATHIALLRGINLAGHNKVAMADLRQLVSSLGHNDVATYIQSGNVVFSSKRADTAALASDLEEAIAAELGMRIRVVVISREELAQVMRDNPYSDEPNPKMVHAVFLTGKPGPDLDERLDEARKRAAQKQPDNRDTAQVIGQTIFLHTPGGYGRSELAGQIVQTAAKGKAGGVAGTARNWATVTKLLAMCDA